MRRVINAIFLLTIFISSTLFAQVTIKESVGLNPDEIVLTGIVHNGCTYDEYTEREINIKLTSSQVNPGESTTFTLWNGEDQYLDDLWYIIEVNTYVEPDIGEITKIGNGEYRFTANSELPKDSTITAHIFYENYSALCILYKGRVTDTARINKTSVDCIDCSDWGGPSLLTRRYGCAQLTINGDSIFVTVTPEVITPGDSAKITIQRKLKGGAIVDYQPNQTFEIGMLDGCALGGLIYCDETEDCYYSSYFYGIPQSSSIYFVADSLADTGTVKLRIGLIENGCSTNSNNKLVVLSDEYYIDMSTKSDKKVLKKEPLTIKKETQANYCFLSPIETERFVNANVKVDKEAYPILLGETKYYQAKYNELERKLDIVEIKDKLTRVSQNEGLVNGEEGWIWITEDIWGSNPIRPMIESNLSAIYWEKRYPIYIDNPGGTNHRDYVNSEKLDGGLIRVMGRFWKEKEASENETDYKNKYSVKLTAEMNNGTTKTIVLRVIKPNQLGLIHNQEINVSGNFYNLDEQIIKFAGEYGIPPQFIKADIEAEGDFNPAFRYEPFYTIKYLYKKENDKVKFGQPHDLLKSSPYRITVDEKIYLDETNINGTAKIGPTEGVEVHQYITNGTSVPLNSYPGYSGSIWDYFYARCKTVNPTAAYDIYPKSEPQWYQSAIDGWDKAFEEGLLKWTKKYLIINKNGSFYFPHLSSDLLNLLARLEANNWLKTKYRGGLFEIGIAQTRLASSYGLMQIIYPTAKSYWKYNDKPEFLNENDKCLTNALAYLKQKIANILSISSKNLDQKSNFSLGLEETYIPSFNNYHGSSLKNYGPKKNIYYGLNVMNRNKKYDPIR